MLQDQRYLGGKPLEARISFDEYLDAMLWYAQNPELTEYIIAAADMNNRERLMEMQTVEKSDIAEPSKEWLRMILSGDTARQIRQGLDRFEELYGLKLY